MQRLHRIYEAAIEGAKFDCLHCDKNHNDLSLKELSFHLETQHHEMINPKTKLYKYSLLIQEDFIHLTESQNAFANFRRLKGAKVASFSIQGYATLSINFINGFGRHSDYGKRDVAITEW